MKNGEKTKCSTGSGRSFLQNLKSTYRYAKKGKKYLLLFLLLNIVLTIISVVVPIISAQRLISLTNGFFERLIIFILIIFIIEILRNIMRYLCGFVYNKFYYDVRRVLQIELTRETLKITQEELNNNSSGIFIERINDDTDNLTDIFAELIDYFTGIIGNVGLLITIIFINVYIGIAYIIFIIIIILYNKYSSGINYKNRKKWKESREKTGGFISEIVRGTKDIKILDAEESFLFKANEYMKETNDISYKYQITKAKMRMLGGNVRDICDFGIGLLMCIFLMSGNLTIEFAIIIYNYHYQILCTADWIEKIYEIIKKFNLSSNRIFGILEDNEFKKEKFGTESINTFKGNIEFKNVTFSYEDNIPILKGLSLKINANETVGFVGPSGAGKTTIFNLISALNKINSGEILLDGININNLDKSSIRGNLSVISQNAYIFNMSILENLRIVKMDASIEDIKEVCHLACLDDFIESLPNKYDTIVGEGGVTLSGGQKQRLAIARALLLKTEILLFDEATSALDNETQTKIKQAIDNLKGEYTILIIAHRLSTVIDSDRIFVIDDGKVESEGTHSYLIKNSKVYNRLYQKETSDNRLNI